MSAMSKDQINASLFDRVKELETEADALRRERDLARDTMTRAGWEYIPDAIGGPAWKPPVNVRMAELRRERDGLRAEIERITEAGRVHIRRAAAFEAQLDRLADALVELRDRIKIHPAYAELTEDEEMCVGGDTAELSYLARVADAALSAIGGGER